MMRWFFGPFAVIGWAERVYVGVMVGVFVLFLVGVAVSFVDAVWGWS